MIYGQDRDEIRGVFVEAWRKRLAGLPLQPLEERVATVVGEHPEYHPALEGDAPRERDYLPEAGESNPFLHMGMHIALQEQIATGRPAGVLEAWRDLTIRLGDAHEAEHQMMECLGEALWQAQRHGQPPDEAAYLECLRTRAGHR